MRNHSIFHEGTTPLTGSTKLVVHPYPPYAATDSLPTLFSHARSGIYPLRWRGETEADSSVFRTTAPITSATSSDLLAGPRDSVSLHTRGRYTPFCSKRVGHIGGGIKYPTDVVGSSLFRLSIN